MKREPSLALVCTFCSVQKSLKEQQGTHLCKQVREKLLTRHCGGGNPLNIWYMCIYGKRVNGIRPLDA